MRLHRLTVDKRGAATPAQSQLGWRIAEVACASQPLDPEVEVLVGARVLDSIGAMLAARQRPAVANVRIQALAHPRKDGAAVVGAGPRRTACEWATLANGVALRELDLGDMYVGADYARPSDAIPALLAVAQQCRRSGKDLVRAISISYEVQVALTRSIMLHRHGISPVLHLGPAIAAGLGALLQAPVEVVVHAVHAAAQLSCMCRGAPLDGVTRWSSLAPASVAKRAIECMDLALRGESAPSAVYEAPQGLVATFLGGPDAEYEIALPEPGEPLRGILDTFPKAHQAQYQCQALIDLALRLHRRITSVHDIQRIEILTSRHLHRAIGSSWRDDPIGEAAPRPTRHNDGLRLLAHALRHGNITALANDPPDALEDRIRTQASAKWSERSHHPDPKFQCFGAQMTVVLTSGVAVTEQMDWPDAHVLGARPWRATDHICRFRDLAASALSAETRDKLVDQLRRLPTWTAAELCVFDFATAEPDPAPAQGAIF